MKFDNFDKSHNLAKIESKYDAICTNELNTQPYSQIKDNGYFRQLVYQDIPKYQGMSYTPPPFREKYEACLWKVDGNTVVKVRHRYFTPEVRY